MDIKNFIPNIGERTKTVARGAFWVFIFGGLARLLTVLTNLLFARELGPEKYGLVNLVVAVGLWGQIIFFLGLNTSLNHYLPQFKDKYEKSWISSYFFLLFITGSITSILYWFGKDMIASLMGVDTYIIKLSLIWVICYGLFIITTSIWSAKELFRRRSISEVVFAFTFVSLLVFYWWQYGIGVKSFVLIRSVSYLLIGLVALFMCIKWFSFSSISSKQSKSLLSYGLIASLGSVSTALLYSPGQFAALKYLSLHDVGIVSLYQNGYLQLYTFAMMLVSYVFFPVASRTPNKLVLFKKMGVWMGIGFIPLLIVSFILLKLLFVIVGKEYTAQFNELILFSFGTVFAIFQGFTTWFLASNGRKGMFFSNAVAIFTGVLNTLGCIWLTQQWAIYGVAISYSVANMVGLLVAAFVFFRFVNSNPTQKQSN